MSLFEEDFDIYYDLENFDGIDFGDVAYLNYYGINLFFYVCGLDHHRVRIFELAKKRATIDNVKVEYLTKDLKPTTSPKIVLEHNSWTKSEYWAKTTKDGRIEINIEYGPLTYMAQKMGVEFPITGPMYAYVLKEEKKKGVANFYWPAPGKKKTLFSVEIN